MTQRVLVLGEDTRSFLSVIRSIGKAGYEVDVVCYDRTSPSLSSKYISQKYYFNYQAYTSEDWLSELLLIANENNYSAIIPCDERAIFPLYENKDAFPEQTVLAIPNQEVIEHLFDKSTTKALAEQNDVAHAKGQLLSLKKHNYQSLSKLFGQQFVIKPTLSFKSDSLSKRQKVEIIETEADFNNWYKHASFEDEYLIETYFEGVGEGVSVLAINGKVLTYFAHTRVSEPKSGGGSSYRKSIKLDAGMAEACKKLCKVTNYTGVGMFEFKKNYRTQEWILIEVNARFWGSLPLAIYSGIDFPKLYIDALLNSPESLSGKRASTTQETYQVNKYARSLTNDVFDIKKELEYNLSHTNKFTAFIDLTKRLLSFSRNLIGRERIDSYDKQDKTPFKMEVEQFYKGIIQPKLPWQKYKNDNNKRLNELLILLQSLPKPNIKVVCYGNIMRSPFGHVYLQTLCDEVGLNWQIDSYGFHLNENRQSPKECITVAANMGIDLTEHRSKWLQQQHIEPNDIVFIFDELNQDKIDRYYNVRNIFNLADFIPEGLGAYKNIDDPYGKGEDGVRMCYLLIAEALKNVFEQYRILTTRL